MLTPSAVSFIDRVDWDDGLTVAWRPHDDAVSPVRCRATHRFGHPAIKGISTAVISEHIDGGEDEHDVAEQFGLGVEDIGWARAYGLSSRLAGQAG